ncbi:EscU/YscU/HrcU family type III secretion system export apparatus switch protein [Kineococcus rubinsiae]|uniref:EscU/YscU/HrcU family type III secretion system export apparatus switch protein n=1 Tax=Kineococcus rubinsiae TaxID=2609562 RepID=UPI00143226CD|nr:EscU/YscU/HrcU family type III secretion system export apparatus switch protein [Kineococcus rubinsiae]NIZ92302.1 EscU/YscU/HrcU family type III secretion system export apparatus switch protein [Kineococcus rubinsiae]
MSGEKTEKPTPKKLKEARQEGNIPQSRDVAAWLSTAAGAVMIPRTIEAGRQMCQQAFSQVAVVAADPDPARALAVLGSTFSAVPGVVGPLAVVTVLAVVVAGAMQGTLAPATKKLKPKFSNLNPVNGFKQHWGPAGVWEGTKSLLKTAVIGLVLWNVAKGLAPQLVGSGLLPMSTIVGQTKASIVSMITVTVLVGLVIAAADYGMSRRRIMGKLKMSVQDIKQEHKNAEGDPLLKGAIRSKQMAMSRNRMMADVAKADVVIVNPTHIAVALRYEPGTGAPRVVAKGAGAIATKIRERARENDVPLVKDIALARTVYKSVKVGQEIPADLYAAVAKVLAFVMSLRNRGASTPLGDAHTVPA